MLGLHVFLKIFFCFLISIIFSYAHGNTQSLTWAISLEEALNKSRALKLSQERQWILLGHYKKSLFGGWKSDIADPAFFLSPEGRVNPKAELESLLAALWAPVTEQDIGQDPRCKFPARLYWLKTKLNLGGVPEEQDPILQRCEMYRRYRAVVSADSLSFVFSSYYANSPGSAFGHTFFRINKKPGPGGKRSELLDHGVGYAAQVTVSNPALYAIFGLAGLFKGVFTNLPYYYKVREYNDFESRDLWSYDLNLTPEEIDMVARHLWEIGNSHFNYYFFTQNCAYLMLTVIEAAAPRYNVAKRVPFYVIPSDTIKAINEEPGLVANVTFRASIRNTFLQRFNKLSAEEKRTFQLYMADLDQQVLLNQNENSKVRMVDAAIDYIDVLYPNSMIDSNSIGAKNKNSLLQTRALIPSISEPFIAQLPEAERPELGHDSARVALGYGTNYLGNSALQLDFRFALHDFLDSHTGYPQFSKLEFFNFVGQLDLKTDRATLDRFDFFRVAAINPWNLFLKKASWRINIGANRFKDGACINDCMAAGLGFGYGYAAFFDGESERFLGYAFVDGQAYHDVHFKEHPYKIALGPSIGLILDVSENLKWQLEGSYLFQMIKSQKDVSQVSSELRYHLQRRWNLGLRYNYETARNEGFLMLYRFF
ncbi:MAG: DUF4105 domain-containing protein [Bdellovibrionaceae bacterium]|nr:DUF4105 domain-containing protein [Pseudobdellovibrionaceae bacterium]